MCQLTDGRRLADAVDADDKDDGRLRADMQRRVSLNKDVLEGFVNFFRSTELLLFHPLTELFDDLAGSLHADVGKDHTLLQFLVKLLICTRKRVKNAAERCSDCCSGLFQTVLDFFEKTHIFLLSAAVSAVISDKISYSSVIISS